MKGFFAKRLLNGTLAVLIGGAVCAAGGIVFVSTFILIVGLSPHFAIPLSTATIAIGGHVFNSRTKSPPAHHLL